MFYILQGFLLYFVYFSIHVHVYSWDLISKDCGLKRFYMYYTLYMNSIAVGREDFKNTDESMASKGCENKNNINLYIWKPDLQGLGAKKIYRRLSGLARWIQWKKAIWCHDISVTWVRHICYLHVPDQEPVIIVVVVGYCLPYYSSNIVFISPSFCLWWICV